jgi:hypothetical protein
LDLTAEMAEVEQGEFSRHLGLRSSGAGCRRRVAKRRDGTGSASGERG